jgi:transposase
MIDTRRGGCGVMRHELSDEAWGRIQDLLPESGKSGGRPWNDHRRTANGIVWILRTGAPWRDLPPWFGSWKSVYGRFHRWSKDGTFDAIVEALQGELDAQGRIDRDLWCIDGSSARATRAAAGAGKKGARMNLRTTLSAVLVAALVRSSTLFVTVEVTRSRPD